MQIGPVHFRIKFLLALVMFLVLALPRVYASPVVVTVTPSSLTIAQGSVGTYQVYLAAGGYGPDSYSLSLSGLPGGASGSFASNPLSTYAGTCATACYGASTSLSLDASTGPLYCPGTYPFTVSAAASSGEDSGSSDTTSLTVTQVGPSLQMSVSTDKPSYVSGAAVTILVSATRPAEGQLTVTPPSGPAKTYSFAFTSSPYVGTAKITAAQPYGTWTATVQADDYCSGSSSASTQFAVGPSTYDVSLSLSGVPSQASVGVQVNGQNSGTVGGSENRTLSFPIGTSHTITVDQYNYANQSGGDPGVRYYSAQNSWSVSAAGSHTFPYQTQYLFDVYADPLGVIPVTGGGWYNAGATAQTSQPSQVVPGASSGTQYAFKAWELDGASQTGNQVSVTMDKPHKAVARYSSQYALTVDSGYGNPQGAGWYDAGSTATFSVNSPVDFLVQHVFVSWTGDYTGQSPQGSILMDAPKTVHANWVLSYIQAYVAAAGVAAAAVVGGAVMTRGRFKRPKAPSGLLPPSPPAEPPPSGGVPTIGGGLAGGAGMGGPESGEGGAQTLAGSSDVGPVWGSSEGFGDVGGSDLGGFVGAVWGEVVGGAISEVGSSLSDVGSAVDSALGDVSSAFTDLGTGDIGAALGDIGSALGDVGLGNLGSSLSDAGSAVDATLGDLSSAIADLGAGDLGGALGDVGSALSDIGLGGLGKTFSDVGSLLGALGSGDLSGALGDAGSSLVDAGLAALGAALGGLGAGGLGQVLNGAGSGLGDVGSWFSSVGDALNDLGLSDLGSAVGEVGGMLGDAGSAVSDLGSALGDLAKGDLGGALSDLGSAVSDLGSAVSDLGSALNDLGLSGLGSVVGSVGSALGDVGSALSDAGTAVGSALSDVGSALSDAGAAIGSALGDVGSAIGDVLGAIGGFLSGLFGGGGSGGGQGQGQQGQDQSQQEQDQNQEEEEQSQEGQDQSQQGQSQQGQQGSGSGSSDSSSSSSSSSSSESSSSSSSEDSSNPDDRPSESESSSGDEPVDDVSGAGATDEGGSSGARRFIHPQWGEDINPEGDSGSGSGSGSEVSGGQSGGRVTRKGPHPEWGEDLNPEGEGGGSGGGSAGGFIHPEWGESINPEGGEGSGGGGIAGIPLGEGVLHPDWVESGAALSAVREILRLIAGYAG